MKYVMFETKLGGTIQHVPIIFPAYLVHKKIVEALLPTLLTLFETAKPVSAGDWSPMSCKATGESVSLDLKSNPEDDSRNILMHYYNHGITDVWPGTSKVNV